MMKTLFIALLSLFHTVTYAQSKQEKAVIERTYLLSQTVFGTKDSLLLEDLFARTATYGHSSGKVENRSEAIAAISKNRSTYKDTTIRDVQVAMKSKTAIVRHLFKANEQKADGSVAPLNFTMMLVWVKERGKWRLMGRQAVKLP